jgi:hypothetical protein
MLIVKAVLNLKSPTCELQLVERFVIYGLSVLLLILYILFLVSLFSLLYHLLISSFAYITVVLPSFYFPSVSAAATLDIS